MKLNLNNSIASLEAELEEKEKLQREAELLAQANVQTEVQAPVEKQDEVVEAIYDALNSLGCSREDIEKAKGAFGKVFVWPWSNEHIYIYRTILRREWDLIKMSTQTPAELMKKVMMTAIVFPAMDIALLDKQPAGVEDSLSEVIMKTSGFVSIDEAMSLVREL